MHAYLHCVIARARGCKQLIQRLFDTWYGCHYTLGTWCLAEQIHMQSLTFVLGSIMMESCYPAPSLLHSLQAWNPCMWLHD
jgi:hypothetical protein